MKIVVESNSGVLIRAGAEPSEKEISIAQILFLKTGKNVEFIPRGIIHTPDILFDGIYWEIKSPEGSGKRTIQHQIQRASLQSCNIIIDTSKTTLKLDEIIARINFALLKTKTVKRLLVVTRDGDILTIL